MFSFNRLALVGLVGALVSHTAIAADMSFGMAPPQPVQLDEARVEIGTGWYLRGDAGWANEDIKLLAPPATPVRENGWVVGLGAGYKFTNWLRADATYDIRGRNVRETGSKRQSAMLNGYLDLGSWSRVTPYIGSGAGVTINDDGTDFTWALMAGVAFDLSSNAKVDLGYRYVQLGRPAQPLFVEKPTAHEVRVGLRYMID